jgi:hypothetical protein
MSKAFNRGVMAGVTALIAMSAALAVAAPAIASSPAEHAVADFMSGPFHVQFTADRAANAPADAATGDFTAHTVIGGTTLLTLQGPITCLDIRGTHLGLFYPVASSSPSLIGKIFRGVYIYVTDSSDGKASSVSFFPTVASTTTSCAPLPGIAPITSGFATFSG